ncbi:MAG: MalY/PatB family protein [Acidimicrobiia bacterium]
MLDNRTPADLRALGSLKWTYFDEDVLAAWVAEMDFGLAPSITTALHDAVDRGDTAYISLVKERATADAAVAFWADRLDWEVSPQQVFSVPDVVEGIRRAIVHLTAPGSAVAMHTPAYYPFFCMVERAGRSLIEVPSGRDHDGIYRIDIDALDRAFGEGAGSFVLCNPWNPTGRCLSTSELEELAAVAASHGGRIISDEIHAVLTYAGSEHVAAASVDSETVVTVTSASKAWDLPGLKCAQVVLTNEEDIAPWNDYFTLEKRVAVGTFGLIANEAAYNKGEAFLNQVMVRLEANRKLLGDLITTHLPDVGYTPPEATYLAWLDFRPYGLEMPAEFLLEHARVALSEGAPFGSGGKGHARLNFATSPSILTEIVERIGAAL